MQQLNCIARTMTLTSSLAQFATKFHYAVQLASRSRAGRRARQHNGIWPEPVCDQVRDSSTCRDSSNLSLTGRKACDQACDLDSVMKFSQSRSQTSSRTLGRELCQIPLRYLASEPARERLMSAEILSAAAQPYEKSHSTRRIALSCGMKISPR